MCVRELQRNNQFIKWHRPRGCKLNFLGEVGSARPQSP